MKTLTITPSDYKDYYLYHYYVDQRLIVKLMRVLGGPILIFVGINFYITHQYHYAVSLFFIGYGVYYIVRPLLDILIRQPRQETFMYNLEDNHLFVSNDGQSSRLNLFDYPLRENKKYFFVYGENKRVIFFPKAKIDIETKSSFDSIIEKLY